MSLKYLHFTDFFFSYHYAVTLFLILVFVLRFILSVSNTTIIISFDNCLIYFSFPFFQLLCFAF